jgi:predicted O-methyltransferase YrrM
MITPTPEFLKTFLKTPGALSVAESIAIMNIAAQVPKGRWCELGTHKGKSIMSAIYGGKPLDIDLVEPEFEKQIPIQDVSKAIISATDKHPRVQFVDGYSTDFLSNGHTEKYSYVFVDSGSHQDGLPMQEVLLLEDKMIQGGIIAFHDFRNQFREPAEAAEYLVSTGKYEWVGIDWQPIFDFVAEHNLEEGNNSWHQYPELPHPPNFVGEVKRK